MTRRDQLLCGIITVAYLALAIPAFSGLPNPDLMAVWGGAMAWMDGAGVDIYAGTDQPFDTLAPQALQAAFDRIDYNAPRFGYIYPPLWLALLGPLTDVTGYETFLSVVTWANNLMMPAMVGLAWAAARPTLPAPLFLLIGLACLVLTQVGGLALFYNQIQIAVSFLIVLAAERTNARAPVAAGIALALAAALKGYPVLLIVLWIGSRDWRALVAFALTGAALAATSVALTGWDMHIAYLDQLRQISGTVLVSPVTFSAPSLIAHLTMVPEMAPVDYGAEHASQIIVAWSPVWLRAASTLGLLAVLAATWRLARQRDPVLWALSAGAISMMTSVAWSHHYLVTFAMLPVLISRLGWKTGCGFVAIGAGLVSYPAIPLWRDLLSTYAPFQIGGTLAIFVALVGLSLALSRRR